MPRVSSPSSSRQSGGPPLGAHASTAGSLDQAFTRAEEIGCEAIQVFVKNPNRWLWPTLKDEDAARFRERRAESPIGPVVAHSAYLVNLAAPDRTTLGKSRRALADELDRCERLGIDGLVVHPGAHLGKGEEWGLERIARSLDTILGERPDKGTRILLENTAGQGTNVGYRLEHLQTIRELSEAPARIGFCIDTCHAFAAGYKVDEEAGYEEFIALAGKTLGLDRVGCMHLNDSRHGRGSRIDRHANPGRGEIGKELFVRLLGDKRLEHIPMILETPVGDDGHGHRRDLALLRRWAAGK